MNKKSKLIILAAGFGLFALLTLTILQSNLKKSSKTILPNISIDQITVGNLTKEQAKNKLYRKYQKTNKFKINIYFENKKIGSISAKDLDYHLPIQSVVDQAYLVGRGKGLSALYQQIALKKGWESYNFDLNPVYNYNYPDTILKPLGASYRKNPINARFEFSDDKVNAFAINQDGYSLDIQNAKLDIVRALNNQRLKPKQTVAIKINKKILKAEIQLKDINNMGIKELVGQGSSFFAGSAPERVHNIVTGTNKINGLIIKPGQTFSFNEFLGEISSSTGFTSALVIKNGKTVLDDGGGICQVSTTMFRTALNAGLPIVERTAHAYRVGYYEQDSKPGMDATIYLPSVDLRFKNDYQSALLIVAEYDLNQMKLTFSLYGTKDNRTVNLSDITMWNVSPPPEAEYVDDFSLPEGTVKQVDFAAWGASTKFTYKVVYPDKQVNEQEFVSNFRPWKAIYLVGKKT